MSRDRVRFEDQMEMIEMYNESNVRTKLFSSIEVHGSFKSLEK